MSAQRKTDMLMRVPRKPLKVDTRNKAYLQEVKPSLIAKNVQPSKYIYDLVPSVMTPNPFGIGSALFSICDGFGECCGDTRQLGPVESSEYL